MKSRKTVWTGIGLLAMGGGLLVLGGAVVLILPYAAGDPSWGGTVVGLTAIIGGIGSVISGTKKLKE